MSIQGSTYPILRFTPSAVSCAPTSCEQLPSLINKDFSSSNLCFNPALADQAYLRPSSTSLSPNKFMLSIPSNLQLKTDELFKKEISASKEDKEISNQTALSPLVINGTEVIADFSGHVRQAYSVFDQAFGTQNPMAVASLGLTSGFSVVTGAMSVKSGIREVKTAEKISDAAGRALSYLKIARGSAFAAGGVVYIPMRALSIAALATTSKIVSVMAGVLGSFASGFFSIGTFLVGIALGIKLNEQRQFRQDLDAILNDVAVNKELRLTRALDHLKKLASVSPEEKAQILSELEADPKYTALPLEQKADKAAEEECLLLQRKEAHLVRVTNEDCLNFIRQKGPAEASQVIEAVQKKSLEKVILSSIAMGLVCIGIALTAASFIFTGPLAILITTAVGIVTSLGWVLVDGYGLIEQFKQNDPGRFDKLWIFISTLVAAISVSLVFLLSSGIGPAIAAAFVGAAWLGINSACYYRLYQLENKKPSQSQ